MLARIVRLSITFPRLVLLASVFLITYGVHLLSRAEFEVFPEFVPAQANVQAEAPGMTAAQVELLVTKPLEDAINGATGVAAVRSQSIQGVSVIDVTFRDGEDPYRARQVVAERLSEVSGSLPVGVGAPTLSPLTSSTMDLIKIGLVSDRLSPMELRDFAQWTLRPRLLSTPGVARVNVFGGGLRRIEVRLRPNDLTARDLSVEDVVDAIHAATQIRGGGYVDTEAQRILIEPEAGTVTVQTLAKAVVAPRPEAPVTLGDIADVTDAATPKFGDSMVMGRPGVLLTLASQYGANTLTATRDVEAALAELKPAIEAQGITLYPAMHRPANFIETALSGVSSDLLLGAVFITIVLFAFTRNLRVALIAFVSIPVSLLTAIIVFSLMGQTLNTMILGGLAVALGVVIDDAVIGIENIQRRLRAHGEGPVRDVIFAASLEVRAPVVYATFVLALMVTPVLFLSGLQGAFFSPLAQAFLLATFASLAVAITLTPALALLILPRAHLPEEPRLLRRLKEAHTDLLRKLMGRPGMAIAITALLGLVSIVGFLNLGAELLPAFRERHYVLGVNGPSGASLDWMRDVGGRISRDLLAIPGVATVEQQIGRVAAGEDTFPPSESEFHVELKKVDGRAEERILGQIRDVLDSYPGLETEALTFLGDRIGESLTGETAAIVIAAYGPDLDQLDKVAADIAAVVRQVPGAVDVQIQIPPATPSIAVTFNPTEMALRGVNASDAYDALETAYQGKVVAQVTDGQRLTDVAVTIASEGPIDPERVGRLTLRGKNGALVPLQQVASISASASRSSISHDGGRRRQVVTANADTRDIAGLTARIRKAISTEVHLPDDVYLEYSGAAEGQAAARHELLVNVVFASIGVIALLILAFRGARPAILILSSAPSALAGGVLVAYMAGGVISLGGLVGFVALFGIAARNAILLVSHADHLVEDENAPWGVETVIRATSERLVPILMTALVTALGMTPLALGSGEAGREVQGPMAQVILGGLATSTLLSLLLLPPLILAYRRPGTLGGTTAKGALALGTPWRK